MNEKKTKISSNVKFTILAVVLIAIFCIAITPVSLQNDTFYTIRIGEHITQNGIDMQDPFSWHEDLAYTYPHWLYDLLTYFIYDAFGLQGIYIVTCILSAILGIFIFNNNRSYVSNKRLYSSKSAISNIYIICIDNSLN